MGKIKLNIETTLNNKILVDVISGSSGLFAKSETQTFSFNDIEEFSKWLKARL